MIDLFKTKSEVINRTPDLEGFNVLFESETGYPHVLSSSCPLLLWQNLIGVVENGLMMEIHCI